MVGYKLIMMAVMGTLRLSRLVAESTWSAKHMGTITVEDIWGLNPPPSHFQGVAKRHYIGIGKNKKTLSCLAPPPLSNLLPMLMQYIYMTLLIDNPIWTNMCYLFQQEQILFVIIKCMSNIREIFLYSNIQCTSTKINFTWNEMIFYNILLEMQKQGLMSQLP